MNDPQASSTVSDWPARGFNPFTDSHLLIEEGLPVRLIATPRANFKICQADKYIADVVARNVEQFDTFPVTMGQGDSENLIGLLDLIPFRCGESINGLIEDRVTRLTEKTLIGADASIFSFMRDPGPLGCRLVVSGSAISGLVSLRVTGHLKPSDSALKNSEEERQKNHHHYHCKINPEGFERLKAENFDNEMRKQILEEAKKLKDAGK